MGKVQGGGGVGVGNIGVNLNIPYVGLVGGHLQAWASLLSTLRILLLAAPLDSWWIPMCHGMWGQKGGKA